jgi:hypothetical protein
MTHAIRMATLSLLLAVTSCAGAPAPDRVALPPTAAVNTNVSWELVGTDWGEPEGAPEAESMCELAPSAPAGRRALAPSSCAD